jgi:hypothetical protein
MEKKAYKCFRIRTNVIIIVIYFKISCTFPLRANIVPNASARWQGISSIYQKCAAFAFNKIFVNDKPVEMCDYYQILFPI